MSEGIFSHLINIIFQVQGSEQAKQSVQSVNDSLIKWDTAKHAGAIESVNTAFDNLGQQGKKTAQTIGDESKKATPKINDFQKALARAAVVAPVWMALRAVMMSFFSLIQAQVKFIIDMEDAMARIQIVGKGTAEEYNNLKFSLVGLALAYGASASEALKAAVIFAQQGKTVSETFLLTRTAMIGAQVLGQDITKTTEDLTAAMNSFNIPAQNATSIIDALINVEKEFAVTSQDLSSGIKTVGATANQMGVSLHALTGDITAVIEVTRKSGSEAARGLQFIYARLLTSAKPVVEQLTGIKFYLDKNGEATSALTGTLRSATDILDELAGKWATLTNEEQLNIAAALGSKRQMVVLNALMQNYTQSINARVVALTSAGSAEKAFNILQDTTSFKLKQLATSWNALTSAIADTSAFKGLIDSISFALQSYTKLIDFEKGSRIELAKESAIILSNVETRQTQIANLEEMIALRDKLLSQPTTDNTTANIEKLNKAISEILSENPILEIAVQQKNPKEVEKVITDIKDQLLAEKINIQVGLEFIPQIQGLSARKRQLQDLTKGLTPKEAELVFPGSAKEMQDIDKKTLEIAKKQRAEVEKQYIIAQGMEVVKNPAQDKQSLEAQIQLTAKEKEQLAIEGELNTLKALGVGSLTEQVQKEIELVTNSQYVYDIHGKDLKLAQLNNQLNDARVRDTQKLVDEELTLADIRGATTKQLLQAKSALLSTLFGENAVRSNLELQLALRKEQTKEMLNQASIGNDSITLYKVAQKEGIQAARAIGEFLTGKIDLERLQQYKSVYAAFQEFFPGKAEALQAEQFFGLRPGGKGFGEGRGIPIPEREAIKGIPPAAELLKQMQINIPAVTATVNGITVQVTQNVTEELKKEDISQDMINKIAESIKNDPELEQQINEQIETF